MPNATDVIGYSFDADVHCVDCTLKRFGPANYYTENSGYGFTETLSDGSTMQLDENCIRDASFDNEGNPVHPIFATDEPGDLIYGDRCRECGEIVVEGSSHFTPEGFLVVERDADNEQIVVEYHDGTRVEVKNVAGHNSARDRYEVRLGGFLYTDALRGPQAQGPSFASDPLGSLADAAISLAESDNAFDANGCKFDECHNLADVAGDATRSENYCAEHSGMVTYKYADVTVIWEGSVDSMDTFFDRPSLLEFLEKEETEIRAAIESGDNVPRAEYGGARIEVSYHTHEFDSRDEHDAWDGECFCESYETVFDSTKGDD